MALYGFAEKLSTWPDAAAAGARELADSGLERDWARRCQLDELPGIAFGAITLVYLVSALASLL